MPAPIRFDDLNTELSFELTECVAEFSALELSDVRKVIEAAHGASQDGYWVAGFVSYEASPAFDDALQVRSRAIGDPFEGLPLAWYGVYRERTEVEPMRRRVSGPSGYGLSAWTPSVTEDEYRSAIDEIHAAIGRGDTYQVNHTFRMRASFAGEPAELYRDLIVAQRGEYGAYIDTGRFQVLSASPERFFRLQGGRLDVRPMKGTTRRGRWTAEDDDLSRRLQQSEKNRAENLMIVDLLRNDLGRVAKFGTVAVEELFALERYETLWQLTSQIGAEVREDLDLPAVFDALFPSGSVTGAPKSSTMSLIRDLESTPRGVYCGAIGYIAPAGHEAGAHFNVAIRTVVLDREQGMAEYGTGGGITWDSEHGSEYDEALLKARVLHSGKESFQLLETLRWEDGEYPFLDRHLERLADSSDYYGFNYSEDVVRKALESLAVGQAASRVRLLMSRNGDCTVEVAETELLPFVDSPQELDFGMNQVHVTLAAQPVSAADAGLFHKTSLRGRYESARAAAPGVDDVILFNELGNVTETTIANVALRFGDVWLTPPVASGCLPGVYRAELLERGTLEVAPIPLSDLQEADEVALINSVRGWRRAVVVPPTRFTGRS